ncbi:hypothetical protein HDU78_009933 [Chytriomyces hyalinus]|nr:hypothetical protein HDU78_009933 [Chytriomyces hyalinus]
MASSSSRTLPSPNADAAFSNETSAMSVWLSLIGREGEGALRCLSGIVDASSDQSTRALFLSAVPSADPREILLSSIPIRAFLIIHAALADCQRRISTTAEDSLFLPTHTKKGKAPANSIMAYRVDLRAEQLAILVSLPENISIDRKGRPINVKSHSALGGKFLMKSKPSEEDVSLHYKRMREFFKSHILDDSIAFVKLTTTDNPIVSNALCDASAWLFPDSCTGCMNYRLQQSFSQRILALSMTPDTLEAQSIPLNQSKAEKDLLLSRDEQLCLSNLHFQSPTTVEAIRPMLKYIAARFDPDDPIEFHSHVCRSLHSSPVTLSALYLLMWGSCQGSLLIQIEGRGNMGPLSVYDDVKEPELNLRERNTQSKMCDASLDERDLEVQNIDHTDTTVKHEDTEFDLTESSALVNIRKQARDLLVSNQQEYTDSILKAAPLGALWTLHLHDKAHSTLRRMGKKSAGSLIPALMNLMMIANGMWTSGTACALVTKTAVVLYEAKVLNNLRIVWQVDVAYLEAPRCYSQVIKVWCIGNHAHVITAVKYVTGAQRAYSQERINRCKLRKEENGIVHPVIFNEDCQDGKVDFKLSISEDDNDLVTLLKIHEASVTAKFIPFSKMFMRLLLSGPNASVDCEFPFAVSEQEAEILNYDRSVIVIGRSGTGKTSCSLFRLLANLHSRRVDFRMNRGYLSHPSAFIPRALQADKEPSMPRKFAFRQIFVTASPKFCRRVKVYFKRLLHSVDPGDITLSYVQEVLDQILNGNPSFSSNDAAPAADGDSPSIDEADLDYDASETVDDGQDVYSSDADFNLPDSFGDLRDADFPLFVHYKKLISMIRVFLGLKEDVALVEEDDAERNVDYERFNEIYASLDKKLTNGLDVSLAFSEIMGVIKGHQSAARTLLGTLSREEYCGLSTRRSGHALQKEGDRNRMYDVFEAYNAKKLERHQLFVNKKLEAKYVPREFDEQDRANEINRVLHKMTEKNDPNLSAILVNQVYLDEVQDLTMAQILPLVTLCSDPKHGLMFAGDTAQVIHRGSVFRFQDLSSMIYQELMPKKAITEAPKQFTLTKNYRSHDGILAVAASVLDILTDLFPNSIDKLKREIGAIAGPQPVLVTDSQGENGIVDFLRGGKSDGEPIEFGAGQVILVRSLKEAVELKTGLTKGYALILTVEQAKGMEFRDVVLYNLITSSSASDQQWRVLLSQLPERFEGAPKFDVEKHNILSAELKILYTAVTRARSRLWVFEKDSKKSDPLFKIWHTKNLVVTSDDARSGKFTSVDSTYEEWTAQGRRLFEEEMYADALRCFQRGLAVANRGNESADTLQCEARLKLVAARALSDATSMEAKSLFYEAGELLRRANQMSRLPAIHLIEAAQCYEICEKHVKASEVYEMIPNPPKEAAQCFRRVRKFDLAGQTLERLNDLPGALQDYIQSPSCSEKALNLVARLKKANRSPDLLTLEQVSTAALANPLLSRKEKVTAIEILPDPDIRKGLFRNQGMYSELSKLAISTRDYHSAGRVMDIEMGDLQEAGRIYKRIGGMTGWLLASECLGRLFWIHVTPAIEAMFCGDSSKMQGLDAVSEIGKNSLLNESIKEMKKFKAMYGKTDPALQTVRWLEIEEAMDPFINRVHNVHTERNFTGSSTSNVSEVLLTMRINVAQDLKLFMRPKRLLGFLNVIDETAWLEGVRCLFLLLQFVVVGLRKRSNTASVGSGVDLDHSLLPTGMLRKLSFSNQEYYFKQVDALFGVPSVYFDSKRLVHQSMFEPRAFDIWKKKLGVRLDVSGRAIVDSKEFYSLASQSISASVLNLFKLFVDHFSKLATFGSICMRTFIYDCRCTATACPNVHISRQIEAKDFTECRVDAIADLTILSHMTSGMLSNRSAAFEELQTKLLHCVTATLNSWECLSQSASPHRAMGVIYSFLLKTIFSCSAISAVPFDVERFLGGSLLLGPSRCQVLVASFHQGVEVIERSAQGRTNEEYPSLQIARNILPKIYYCATTTAVFEFISIASELLEVYAKPRQYSSIVNGLNALCTMAELLMVALLSSTRVAFILPERLLEATIKRFPGMFNNSIEHRLENHITSVMERIDELLGIYKAAMHENVLLRLAYISMLLNQHSSDLKRPAIGIPAWVTERDGWDILKRLSVVEQDAMVLVWREKVRSTDSHMKNAILVCSLSLEVPFNDSREFKDLVASIQTLNSETVTSITKNDGEFLLYFPSPCTDQLKLKNVDSFSESSESNGEERISDSAPPCDDAARPSLTNDAYFELHKARAESGDVQSKFVLGMLYLNGSKQSPKDQATALSWLVQAHVGGHSNATLQLGDLFFEGTQYPKDYKKATSYYLALMRSENTLMDPENTMVQVNLGRCYYQGGFGIQKNVEKAVKFFDRAAEAGNSSAQFYLAGCYARGDSVQKDQKKALALYEKASLQGHKQAAAVLRKLTSSGSPTEVKTFPVGSDSEDDISPIQSNKNISQLSKALSNKGGVSKRDIHSTLPPQAKKGKPATSESAKLSPDPSEDTSADEDMRHSDDEKAPKIPSNKSQMQSPQVDSNSRGKGLAARGRSVASKKPVPAGQSKLIEKTKLPVKTESNSSRKPVTFKNAVTVEPGKPGKEIQNKKVAPLNEQTSATPIKLVSRNALPKVEKPVATPATQTKAANKILKWWLTMKTRQKQDGINNRMPRIFAALRLWPKSRTEYLNAYLNGAMPIYLELLEVYGALEKHCVMPATAGTNIDDMKVYFEAIDLREKAIHLMTELDPHQSSHLIKQPSALKATVLTGNDVLERIKVLITSDSNVIESGVGQSSASNILPPEVPVASPNTQASSALKAKVASKKKKRRK